MSVSVDLVGLSSYAKANFFRWRNDPKVWKWCRQNGPLSQAEHDSYWYKTELDHSSRFFALKDNLPKIGGDIVGCAGLTSIDLVNSRAEFSLYIGPEHHGKGYGTDGLKALFSWGFGYLNLNSIWGESFDGNPALRIFDKLNLSRDGIRRDFYFRDGRYIDAHLVSVKRNEWEQSMLRW